MPLRNRPPRHVATSTPVPPAPASAPPAAPDADVADFDPEVALHAAQSFRQFFRGAEQLELLVKLLVERQSLVTHFEGQAVAAQDLCAHRREEIQDAETQLQTLQQSIAQAEKAAEIKREAFAATEKAQTDTLARLTGQLEWTRKEHGDLLEADRLDRQARLVALQADTTTLLAERAAQLHSETERLLATRAAQLGDIERAHRDAVTALLAEAASTQARGDALKAEIAKMLQSLTTLAQAEVIDGFSLPLP